MFSESNNGICCALPDIGQRCFFLQDRSFLPKSQRHLGMTKMKNHLRTIVASATLIACAAPAMADVTVQGDYIQIGVNANGSLIDFGSFIGLKYDPSGTGNFSSPIDFVTPGIPFAFYSIGVTGSSAVAGAGSSSNPFATSTVDLSAGADSPFVLTKNGSYAGLTFKQVLSFDVDSKVVHSSVTFKNKSAATVNNVAYGVGLDPDQDANIGGSTDTNNSILGQGANASVSAMGILSGYSITLSNTGGWTATTASITDTWETNPYVLSSAATDSGNGDYTIGLGFQLGNFAVNQEKTISYDYTISAVPEPGNYAMFLAGLGLLGFMRRRRS